MGGKWGGGPRANAMPKYNIAKRTNNGLPIKLRTARYLAHEHVALADRFTIVLQVFGAVH